MHVVESLPDQAQLEALIEGVKPDLIDEGSAQSARRLHPLLATPFRYPPLDFGSRFGTRNQRGIWYGASVIRTVLYEIAFYRFLDFDRTEVRRTAASSSSSIFKVRLSAERDLDLCRSAFDKHRTEICHPSRYTESQALGATARRLSVQTLRYPSSRAPDGGTCVAVLHPDAFERNRPERGIQRWTYQVDADRILFERAPDYLLIPRNTFLINGKLPLPAN